jgi:hypothetical protein
MELNTEKIETELKRIGKNKKWLAKKMGVYPSMITYIFHNKPITQAERIAKALNLNARDLIK